MALFKVLGGLVIVIKVVIKVLKVKVFKVLGELVIIEGPPLLDLLTASLGSPAVNQGNYSNLNRLLKEAHRRYYANLS